MVKKREDCPAIKNGKIQVPKFIRYKLEQITKHQCDIKEIISQIEFWMPKLQNVNVAQCLFATSIDRQGTVVKAKEGIAVLTKYLQAIADESKEVMKPEINNSIKEK